MMFWLLALVLLASLAGIGYRQGAIRVAFSLVGILLGALLAGPLGKLVKPLLVVVRREESDAGVGARATDRVPADLDHSSRSAAFMVHQKVDVHFKYHAGDLRLALWERLNRRLGLCLGLVNGALYIILISFVIFTFSYWTVQMASDDKDPRLVRILNRLGQDLQSTGFAKVARAIDPMPQVWYDAADLAGLIYNNPLMRSAAGPLPGFPRAGGAARNSRTWPVTTQFTELLLRPDPIMEVLDQPKAQAILQNPDLLKLIWTTVVPDLKDLPILPGDRQVAEIRLGEDSGALELST